MKLKIVKAALAGSIVLFLWDGLWQAIPGVGVRAVTQIQKEHSDVSAQNVPGMRYEMSASTVSFIATQPAEHYSIHRFFFIEFLCALGISFAFALALARTSACSFEDRMKASLLVSMAATCAVHIPYWNWWGFSTAYTVGVVLRLVGGWQLLAYVQNKFLLR